jgi:hypothetical protein
MTTVTLQYFDGCPNWRIADARLRQLQKERDFVLEHRQVRTPEEAERLQFRGSPSILVDGVDPFVVGEAPGDAPRGLACRVFATPEGPTGSPTIEQLRAALA